MPSQCIAIVMLVSALLPSGQVPQAATPDQASLVVSAQNIAIDAVTFREGDATGFSRAQPNFTADGWKDFVDHMNGFLDRRGAPTFTSRFVALHDAIFLGEKDGVLLLRIPGTLTQSNKSGRTTYRAALKIQAVRDVDSNRNVKIQRLEQITCAGQSAECQ